MSFLGTESTFFPIIAIALCLAMECSVVAGVFCPPQMAPVPAPTMTNCDAPGNDLVIIITSGDTVTLTNSFFRDIQLTAMMGTLTGFTITIRNCTFRKLQLGSMSSSTVLLDGVTINAAGALPSGFGAIPLVQLDGPTTSVNFTAIDSVMIGNSMMTGATAVTALQATTSSSITLRNVAMELKDSMTFDTDTVHAVNLISSNVTLENVSCTTNSQSGAKFVRVEAGTSAEVTIVDSAVNSTQCLLLAGCANCAATIRNVSYVLWSNSQMMEYEAFWLGWGSTASTLTVDGLYVLAATPFNRIFDIGGPNHKVEMSNVAVDIQSGAQGMTMFTLLHLGTLHSTVAVSNVTVGLLDAVQNMRLVRTSTAITGEPLTNTTVVLTNCFVDCSFTGEFSLLDLLSSSPTNLTVALRDSMIRITTTLNARLVWASWGQATAVGLQLQIADSNVTMVADSGEMLLISTDYLSSLTGFGVAISSSTLNLRGMWANLTHIEASVANTTSLSILDSNVSVTATAAQSTATLVLGDAVAINGLNLAIEHSTLAFTSSAGSAHLLTVSDGSSIDNFVLTNVGQTTVEIVAQDDTSALVLEAAREANISLANMTVQMRAAPGTQSLHHAALAKLEGMLTNVTFSFEWSAVSLERASLSAAIVRFENAPPGFIAEGLAMSFTHADLLFPLVPASPSREVLGIADFSSINTRGLFVTLRKTSLHGSGNFNSVLRFANGTAHNDVHVVMEESDIDVVSTASASPSSMVVVDSTTQIEIVLSRSSLKLTSAETVRAVALHRVSDAQVKFVESNVNITCAEGSAILFAQEASNASVTVEGTTVQSSSVGSVCSAPQSATVQLNLLASSFDGLRRPVDLSTTAGAVTSVRVNCSWWYGKRLVLGHFRATEQSALLFWPESLSMQEHLICPGSITQTSTASLSRVTTPTPSTSSRLSATSSAEATESPTLAHQPSSTISSEPGQPTPSLPAKMSTPTGSVLPPRIGDSSITASRKTTPSNLRVTPTHADPKLSSETTSVALPQTESAVQPQDLQSPTVATKRSSTISLSPPALTAKPTLRTASATSTLLPAAKPTLRTQTGSLTLLPDGSSNITETVAVKQNPTGAAAEEDSNTAAVAAGVTVPLVLAAIAVAAFLVLAQRKRYRFEGTHGQDVSMNDNLLLYDIALEMPEKFDATPKNPEATLSPTPSEQRDSETSETINSTTQSASKTPDVPDDDDEHHRMRYLEVL